jgi:hypothetical protein
MKVMGRAVNGERTRPIQIIPLLDSVIISILPVGFRGIADGRLRWVQI